MVMKRARKTVSNPLKAGWSREVISQNIAEMMDKGRQQAQSVAAALTAARKSYRKRHPRGAYPHHLKLVKNNPVFSTRQKVSNPRNRDFERAVRLYESFHGTEPKFVDEMFVAVPDVAMVVGKIAAIEYQKPHNKRDQFRHEFSGRSMPTLAVSHDGKQLIILDGHYHFNDHGIIDGPAPE